MNHIFRVIFDKTRGIWVAVSELTKARGKEKSQKSSLQLRERFNNVGVSFSEMRLSTTAILVASGLLISSAAQAEWVVTANGSVSTSGDREGRTGPINAITLNPNSGDRYSNGNENRQDGVAIGTEASVRENGGVAVGRSAQVRLANGVAIGNGAKVETFAGGGEAEGIAIGKGANAKGQQAVVLGANSGAISQATAIGTDVFAQGGSSIAIGNDDLIGSTNNQQFRDTLPLNTIKSIYGKLWDSNGGRFFINESAFLSKYSGANAIYSPTYAKELGAIAIGSRTVAAGEVSTALGSLSFALANRSTAVGIRAFVSQNALGGTAIGEESRVFAPNSVAIGNITEATNTGTVAYGYKARAVGANSIALGVNVVSGAKVVAGGDIIAAYAPQSNGDIRSLNDVKTAVDRYFHDNEDVTQKKDGVQLTIGNRQIKKSDDGGASNSIVLGNRSISLKSNTVALGYGTLVDADNSIGIGSYNYITSSGADSIVLGLNNRQRGGANNTIVGLNNVIRQANGTKATTDSIIVGSSVYLGQNASASAIVGNDIKVSGNSFNSLVIGKDASVGYSNDDETQGIGSNNAMVLGSLARVRSNSSNSFALGYQAEVHNNAADSFAVGKGSRISQGSASSAAIGVDAFVDVTQRIEDGNPAAGLALGNSASVTMQNSVALGVGSKTDYGYSNLSKDGWVAKGAISIPTSGKTGVISVGAVGLERRIVNVASGALDTDAVNVAQLRTIDEKFELQIEDLQNGGGVQYLAVDRSSNFGEAGQLSANLKISENYQQYVKLKTQALYFAARQKLNNERFNQASLDALNARIRELGEKNGGLIKRTATDLNAIETRLESTSDSAQFNSIITAISNASGADASKTPRGGFSEEEAVAAKQGNNYLNDGAKGADSIAIGWKAKTAATTGNTDATAGGKHSIAIGFEAGGETGITKQDAIAIGTRTQAEGIDAIAIGREAKALGEKSISIGQGNTVNGARSGAFGDPSTVSGDDSYSIGNSNTVTSNSTFVLGNNVTTSNVNGAVYLGEGSGQITNEGSRTSLGTAYGGNEAGAITINGLKYFNFAGNSPGSFVTIGNNNIARLLQGVAAGTISATSTDAINGSQLYEVARVLGQGYTLEGDEGLLNLDSSNRGQALVGSKVTLNTSDWTSVKDNAKYSGDNIQTFYQKDATGNSKITIGVKESPTFKDITAETIGKQGGAKLSFNDANVTINEKKITGLADAALSNSSTDAVTGKQLYALQEKTISLSGNSGTTSAKKLSDNPSFAIKGADTGYLTTTAAGDNVIIDLNKSKVLEELAKPTDGFTKIDGSNVPTKTGNLTAYNAWRTALGIGDGVNWFNVNASAPVEGSIPEGTSITTSNFDKDHSGATGTNSTAIGPFALASGTSAVAIGKNVRSTVDSMVAIGDDITATVSNQVGTTAGQYAIAIGHQAGTKSDNTVNTLGHAAVAVGSNAYAPGTGATALGATAGAVGSFATAVGRGSQAVSQGATALGMRANATGVNSTVVGANSTASALSSGAFGQSNTVGSGGLRSYAFGLSNTVNDSDSLAFGKENTIGGFQSVAIGKKNTIAATADRSGVWGTAEAGTGEDGDDASRTFNTMAGHDSYSIGNSNNVTANANWTFVLGNNVTADKATSVYLGDRATFIGDTAVSKGTESGYTSAGSIAGLNFKNFAGSNVAGIVTISSQLTTGGLQTRRLQGVAPGLIAAGSTDAINGSQLFDTNTKLGNLATDVKTKFGGNAVLDADTGKITFTNIGGTNKDNIHDAIAASREVVEAAANGGLTVTPSDQDSGAKKYTVKIEDSLKTKIDNLPTNTTEELAKKATKDLDNLTNAGKGVITGLVKGSAADGNAGKYVEVSNTGGTDGAAKDIKVGLSNDAIAKLDAIDATAGVAKGNQTLKLTGNSGETTAQRFDKTGGLSFAVEGDGTDLVATASAAKVSLALNKATTVTENEGKVVTSGAVYTAIEEAKTALTEKGLSFSADTGSVKKSLGETLGIKGDTGYLGTAIADSGIKISLDQSVKDKLAKLDDIDTVAKGSQVVKLTAKDATTTDNQTLGQENAINFTVTGDDSVDTSADGSSITVKVAEGGITTDHIKDGTIQTADLADGAVTTPKLATGAVTEEKLADPVKTKLNNADQTANTLKERTIALGGDKSSTTDAKKLGDGNIKFNITGGDDITTAASGDSVALTLNKATDFADATLARAITANAVKTVLENLATNILGTTFSNGAFTAPVLEAVKSGLAGNTNNATAPTTIIQAIQHLTTAANKGLTFAAQSGNAITRQLGETLTLKGQDNYLQTSSDGDGAITVSLTDAAKAKLDNVGGKTADAAKKIYIVDDAGTQTTEQTLGQDGDISFGVVKGDNSISTLTDGKNIKVKVADGGITTQKLAAGAVTTEKIANGAVTTEKIADGAITSDKIANKAVTNVHLADGAVDSRVIKNGSIQTEDISDQAIDGLTKIKKGSVGDEQLAGDIDGSKLKDNSVDGAAKLKDGSVTGGKLADGTITESKLDQAVSNKINKTFNNTLKLIGKTGTASTSTDTQLLSKDGGLEFVIEGTNGIEASATGNAVTVKLEDTIKNKIDNLPTNTQEELDNKANKGLDNLTNDGKNVITGLVSGSAKTGDLGKYVTVESTGGTNGEAKDIQIGLTQDAINKLDAIDSDAGVAKANQTLKLGGNTNSETTAQDFAKEGGLKFNIVGENDGADITATANGDTVTLKLNKVEALSIDTLGTADATNDSKAISAGAVKQALNTLKTQGIQYAGTKEGANTVQTLALGGKLDFVGGDGFITTASDEAGKLKIDLSDSVKAKLENIDETGGATAKASQTIQLTADAEDSTTGKQRLDQKDGISFAIKGQEGYLTSTATDGTISLALADSVKKKIDGLSEDGSLTLKANGVGAQKVALADGVNFVNSDNTTASVAANGDVSFTVSKGLKFGADVANATTKYLDDQLNINSGDITENNVNYVGKNLKTKVDNGNILVGFNEKPEFKALDLSPDGTNKITLTPDAEGNLTLSKSPVADGGDNKVVIKGIKDGDSADSAVTKGTFDKLKQLVIGTNGKDGAPGADGKDYGVPKNGTDGGPANSDGLNGTPLANKVQGLRDGIAGTVVYTDEAGKRVLAEDGKYYDVSLVKDDDTGVNKRKANNGLWYDAADVNDDGTVRTGVADDAGKTLADLAKDNTSKVLGNDKVMLSSVNPDGTTVTPVRLANLASVLGELVGDDDASKAEDARDKVEALLGKASPDDAVYLTRAATAADLQVLAEAGLDFLGNQNGEDVTKKIHTTLGSTLSIQGKKNADYDVAGVADKYSADNLITHNDDGTLRIEFLKAPTFEELVLNKDGTGIRLTPTTDDNNNPVIKFSKDPADTGENADNRVVLDGIKDGTSPDSVVTKGTFDAVIGKNGLSGVDGKNGLNGSTVIGQPGKPGKDGVDGLDNPAGQDGQNGTTLANKVQALRDGIAGTVVYTDEEGNRLLAGEDGKYYSTDVVGDKIKANNGLWYDRDQVNPDGTLMKTTNEADGKTITDLAKAANKPALEKDKVILSAVDSEGKTVAPITIANLASVLGGAPTSDDAAAKATNAQTKVADLLGKNATNDANYLSRAATAADLQVLAEAGIDFLGNQDANTAGTKIHKTLGSTLSIEGKANALYGTGEHVADKYSADNLITHNDDGKLRIEFLKTPTFEGVNLVKDGAGISLTPKTDKDSNTILDLSKSPATEGADNRVVIDGVKDGTSPDSVVTKGAIDKIIERIGEGKGGISGIDGKEGVNGESGKDFGVPNKGAGKGPAANDGLNGTTLANKVQGLRDGIAGTVVYTDLEGNRVLAENGKYYDASLVTDLKQKASNGLWYEAGQLNDDGSLADGVEASAGKTLADLAAEPGKDSKVIANDKVMLSAVNPDGSTKTTPVNIANLASALGAVEGADAAAKTTDAQTKVTQLLAKDPTATGEEGTANATFLSKAATAGDLQTLARAGIRFNADNNAEQTLPLGSVLTVAGQDGYITTTASEGKISLALTDAVKKKIDGISGDGQLRYTANATATTTDADKQKVSLEKGFNFTDTANITASTEAEGVVKFSLNDKLTGITNITNGDNVDNPAGATVLNISDAGLTLNDKQIKGLADGTDKGDAITVAQLEKLAERVGVNKDGTNGTSGIDGKEGKNGTDAKDYGIPSNGTNGLTGPAGRDGLNGTPIANKVQGLRDGIAGTVVYTDEAGNRVLAENGKYYTVATVDGKKKANDGLWYDAADVLEDGTVKPASEGTPAPEGKTLKELAGEDATKVLANDKVMLSSVNPDGSTTEPVRLANLASVLGGVPKASADGATTKEADAQAKVAELLGKDATSDANYLSRAATAADLQVLAEAGIDFLGNQAEATGKIHKQLGTTLSIEGKSGVDYDTAGVANKYSADNLITHNDSGKLRIEFLKTPNFEGLELKAADGTGTVSITPTTDGTGLNFAKKDPNNPDAEAEKVTLSGLKDGTTPDSAVTKGTIDKLIEKIGQGTAISGIDGKEGLNGKDGKDYGVPTNGADGVDGKNGPAGRDGLNGTTLANKVQGLRDGIAGTVVYTDTDGNRVLAENGKYYDVSLVSDPTNNVNKRKANNGLWYDADKVAEDGSLQNGATNENGQTLAQLADGDNASKVISPENVMLSAVNPDGKTVAPVVMSNVASALGLKPVSDAADDTTKSLGGEPITESLAKSVVSGDNGLLSLKGADLNKVATVGDLQAVAQAGLDFGANEGNDVHRTLGTKVSIVGKTEQDGTASTIAEADKAKYTGDNLATFTDTDKNLIKVEFLKTPKFEGLQLQAADGTGTVNITPNTDGTGITFGKDGANGEDGKIVISGIKDGEGADSAVTKGAIDKIIERIGAGKDGINGIDGRPGKNGEALNDYGIPKNGTDGADGSNGLAGGVGPAGRDGLNGTTLANKVQGLRDGVAGTVVYTDEEGNRVLAENGKYYKVDLVSGKKKANDGLWYDADKVGKDGSVTDPDATGNTLAELAAANDGANADKVLAADKVLLSAVNPDGTTVTPVRLANLANALGGNLTSVTANSTEAEKQARATDAQGRVEKLLAGQDKDGENLNLSRAATAADLQVLAEAGVDFLGNQNGETAGKKIHKQLGKTLSIEGKSGVDYDAEGVAAKYSADNLITYNDNGVLRIGFLQAPTFKSLILDNGLADGENAKVTLTPTKQGENTVLNLSDGKDGADGANGEAGKVVIAGIKDGETPDSAVTKGAIDKLIERIGAGTTGINGIDGNDTTDDQVNGTKDFGVPTNGKDAVDGKKGPAGRDGLNGTTLANKVQGLRDGIAGTVVYTDVDGKRVLAENGVYYKADLVANKKKANDGLWYAANEVAEDGSVITPENGTKPTGQTLKQLAADSTDKVLQPANVRLSAVNADGRTTEPTVLANIADGKIAEGSKEAVNGGQLHSLATALGTSIADDGTITQPTIHAIKDKDGTDKTAPTNIVGAVNGVIDTVNSGLTFSDGTTDGKQQLGSKVTIKGNEDTTLTADKVSTDNVKVTYTNEGGNGTFKVALKKDAVFDTVTAGDPNGDHVVLNGNSITGKKAATDPDAEPVTTSKITLGEDAVTLSNGDGTDPVKLSGIAAGENDNDAVNKKQVDEAIKGVTDTLGKGLNVATEGVKTADAEGGVSKQKLALGNTVKVKDGINTTVSKVEAEVDAEGNATGVFSYTININGMPMSYVNKDGKPLAKVGDSFFIVNDDGTLNTDNTDAESTKVAGVKLVNPNEGKAADPVKLSNVAEGDITADSTDAINGSQLHSVIGADAFVDDPANAGKKKLNIAGTGKSNINDALKKIAEDAKVSVDKADDNITVEPGTASDGGKVYKVGLSRNINVDSISFGQGEGAPRLSVDAEDPSALSVNGARLTGLADGVAPTDAVNMRQFQALDGKINKVNRHANAGIALAIATASLPQAIDPGANMLSLSGGSFEGETASAIGFSRRSDNGKLIIKANGSWNSRGKLGVGVGIGYQWR